MLPSSRESRRPWTDERVTSWIDRQFRKRVPDAGTRKRAYAIVGYATLALCVASSALIATLAPTFLQLWSVVGILGAVGGRLIALASASNWEPASA